MGVHPARQVRAPLAFDLIVKISQSTPLEGGVDLCLLHDINSLLIFTLPKKD
uniref:Uncharacterized protein n=1 Tax=Arion vulgaris TaxID=1028688 RepID=A0A0B6ZNX6_9EUPU